MKIIFKEFSRKKFKNNKKICRKDFIAKFVIDAEA